MSSRIGARFFGHFQTRTIRNCLARPSGLRTNRPISSTNKLSQDNDDVKNVPSKIIERRLLNKKLDSLFERTATDKETTDEDSQELPDSEPNYYLEPNRDVGQIFIRDDVQDILKSITRFEEERVFARRPMPTIATPRFVFMTDQQLAQAKEMAYESVKARMQFPVVMRPTENEDSTICYEPEIQGAFQNKVIFIDINMNHSERNRLMSVREPNGLLRWPTFNERSRMNNLFFPTKERSIEVPKLFTEEELMQNVLNRGDYVYLLDRACLQFEPDDPQFVKICCTAYNFIDKKGHYDRLRSTRHFGPMSLYLAYYKRIDNLLLDMLQREYFDNAAQLAKLYLIANDLDVESTNSLSDIGTIEHYTKKYSLKKHLIEPALQSTLLSKLTKQSSLSN